MANHFSALKSNAHILTAAVLVTLLFAACAEQDTPKIVPASPDMAETTEILPHSVLPDLTDWAELTTQQCPQRLDDFRTATKALEAAITLVPGAESHDVLEDAQQTWREALSAWAAAQWCIADALPGTTRSDHQNRLALVSAAPALAGFIDAVPGHEDSGIVNDENVPMEREDVLAQHQITDDGEVAVGLYALEVLLYGIVHRNRADFGNPDAGNKHHTTRRSEMLLLLSEHLSDQASEWEAYWAAHAPEGPESRAVLVTHQAHTVFTQLATISEQIDLSGPGLALYREHDALRAAAWLEVTLPWWQAEATEELVQAADLPLDKWQSTGAELASFEQNAPDWALLSWQSEQAAMQLGELLHQLPIIKLPAF